MSGHEGRDNLVELSLEDLDSLRHMLGVQFQKPRSKWGYRNYFVADQSQISSMERLRSAGLVAKGKAMDGMQLYHATEKGGDAAGLSWEQIRSVCLPNDWAARS